MTRTFPCFSTHAALVEHAWSSLELCRNGQRYMPDTDDAGQPCLLELANCGSCHSTLARQVPLLSVEAAEAEALRVWRFKTGLVDAEPAAYELRSMARPLFTGDE